MDRYRIRWNRPTSAPGFGDVVFGAETEYDSPPVRCWTRGDSFRTFMTRQEAVEDRLIRCSLLAINPENPMIFIEETCPEGECAWRPSV